ncbi:MAG TPA: translocation/assembly module TamB domain-containing protein [Candidatus Binatia bacterium]|nr:translocation/assembly module TamB domain-containing protein [Candidatus Binatia bacterium]
MKKFLIWIRWSLIGCAVLLLAGIAAILFYAQTDSFRRTVEEKALTAINEAIDGDLSWDRMEGSLLGNLRFYDLRLHYRDRDVFRAARAELGYALLPLLWGRVQITQLKATRPWLELRKDSGGDWTIVEALSTGEPSGEPSKWVVHIDGIAIEAGEMIFEPEASKPEVYRVRGLDLNGAVQVATGLDARVERLGGWVEAGGAPQIHVSGALRYSQTTDTESLALEKFWLQTAQSKIMLAGTIKDFDRFESDLQVNIAQAAAADLARFIPQWPAGVAVRGDVRTRGTGNALDTRFKLALADSEVSGTLRADVLSENKPYSGAIAVRSLELAKVLPRKDFAGVINADLKISGAATNLDSIKSAGAISVRSAVVNRMNLGEITLQGTFTPRIADFTGALNGPLARATWRTHLVLSREPEYRIELTVPSLDAARLLQLDNSTPAQLSFKGMVEGSGFDLKSMNTRANLDLLRSHLGSVTVEQGKILARISQGRLQLQQAQLEATGATLNAQGYLGVDLEKPGRLDYRLEVTNLAPWLELFEREGTGRLEVSGKATGNLARLQTTGAMTLRGINLSELALQSGRLNFALERQKDATLPEGNINLEATDVRAGVQLARLQAAIKLPPPGNQAIAVSATARDREGRSHRLIAELENQPSALLVRAKELTLSLPGGSWRLARPATITRPQDDFIVDQLVLRNQNQTLSVSGRFSSNGAQALDATIDGLSLEVLKAFSTSAPDLTGNLSAWLQIRGTAAAPAIEAKAEITGSKIAGQSYRGLRATSRYRNQNIALDVVIDQDSTHSLDIRGTIPLALSWQDGWRAQPLGGMDLRARSSGLSLAFLNAFTPAAIQNINGEVVLDIALRGTLRDPEPRGKFSVRDGTFNAKALGTKVTGLFAQASADAQRISLSRLTARAGSGTLEASGVLSLRQFAAENINVTVTAQRWPAVQTDQYRAIINSNLRVSGPITAPLIAGAVEVVEGNIRPSLGFLERGAVPLKRDPTIVVVRSRGEEPAPLQSNGSAPEENGLLQYLSLQLTVTIPNNLWVRHPNANVELSGNLTLTKKPESDFTISGPLEIVRGWVGFQGRRFTLSRGRIEFTGGKPTDAILDLSAEYRVQGYLVSAVASGTADKPSLVLQSQPVLEQSDILALLLFGKPVADLSNTEQVSLQQNAIDITAGFAAATLGGDVDGILL